MGARFAPSCADLFMGHWELKYIWANNPFGRNLVLYSRYIDDVLIIWNCTNDELEGFLKQCARNPFGISFTHVVYEKSLVFLDLELQANDNGVIHSRTHFKPTAGYSYLHARSHHHPRWSKNVPFGQFCRLKWTCSLKKD